MLLLQLPHGSPVLHVPDLLTHTVQTARPWLQRYGLWVVALGLFGETFFFSGPVVPGFTILLSVGYFVAAGWLPAVPAITTAITAAVLGDVASYWMGYRWGHRLLLRKRDLATRLRMALESEGVWLLLWYHYVAGLRSLVACVAGSSHYSARRFLVYDALGVVLWVDVVIGFGYGSHSAFHARAN